MFINFFSQICEHPEIFLYDTPGVMIPKIDSEESALKLAITGKEQHYNRSIYMPLNNGKLSMFTALLL